MNELFPFRLEPTGRPTSAGRPGARLPSYACRMVDAVAEGWVQYHQQQFKGSYDVYQAYRGMAAADREQFWTLLLDNKNRFVGQNLVAIGSLTTAIVHPREVLKPIILTNAAATIFVHNHPSGDPAPSKEDLAITKRLRELCELLGVRALDHVVIGRDRYCSFVDDGYW